MLILCLSFFFSSRRRQTRCALVTGVQTCALPIFYEPKLLLLDEPLSNLDAKLRERARTWLTNLQRRLAVTTVYVTHDQTEALTMSDEIAVMNQGRIAQQGTPVEIYSQPNSPFVADFIGTSNFIRGRVVSSNNGERSEEQPSEPPVTTEHPVCRIMHEKTKK